MMGDSRRQQLYLRVMGVTGNSAHWFCPKQIIAVIRLKLGSLNEAKPFFLVFSMKRGTNCS